MNTFFQYLMESALGIILLFAVYWMFLRSETFFMLNRVYLISMILFSMIIPLIPLGSFTNETTGDLSFVLEPVVITAGKIDQVVENNWQWMDILATAYLTGIGIFLARFIFRMVQLMIITGRNGIRKRFGIRLVPVDRGYAPFSFFNIVYINEKLLTEQQIKTILEHEKIHISQFHTVDLIMVEIITIIQWFNPVVWLLSREFRSLHEFLADEGVLQTGISTSQYQQMILDESMGIRVNDLTNSFNVSLLKKRIVMMTKLKSAKWARVKMLLAFPAIFALLIVFTASSLTDRVLVAAGSEQTALTSGEGEIFLTPQDKAGKEQKQKQEQMQQKQSAAEKEYQAQLKEKQQQEEKAKALAEKEYQMQMKEKDLGENKAAVEATKEYQVKLKEEQLKQQQMQIAMYDMQQDKEKQQKSAQDGSTVYSVVEKMPTYPGGTEAMIIFLVQNIKYPEAAKSKKLQGTVYVSFIVSPEGAIRDAKIHRGIGSGCDEEALRVVNMMPKWNPGQIKGKPVNVSFMLPVKFMLSDKKEKSSPEKK